MEEKTNERPPILVVVSRLHSEFHTMGSLSREIVPVACRLPGAQIPEYQVQKVDSSYTALLYPGGS